MERPPGGPEQTWEHHDHVWAQAIGSCFKDVHTAQRISNLARQSLRPTQAQEYDLAMQFQIATGALDTEPDTHIEARLRIIHSLLPRICGDAISKQFIEAMLRRQAQRPDNRLGYL